MIYCHHSSFSIRRIGRALNAEMTCLKQEIALCNAKFSNFLEVGVELNSLDKVAWLCNMPKKADIIIIIIIIIIVIIIIIIIVITVIIYLLTNVDSQWSRTCCQGGSGTWRWSSDEARDSSLTYTRPPSRQSNVNDEHVAPSRGQVWHFHGFNRTTPPAKRQ